MAQSSEEVRRVVGPTGKSGANQNCRADYRGNADHIAEHERQPKPTADVVIEIARRK
jgi:hypothetical protein